MTPYGEPVQYLNFLQEILSIGFGMNSWTLERATDIPINIVQPRRLKPAAATRNPLKRVPATAQPASAGFVYQLRV